MELDGTPQTDIAADEATEAGGAWSSTAQPTAFVRYRGTRSLERDSYAVQALGRDHPQPREQGGRSALTRSQEPAPSAAWRSGRLIRSFTLLLLRSTPMTGSYLRRQLELAGLRPDAGGLYRLLARLERDGHVASVAAVGEGRGSAERRVYLLTACGVEQLEKEPAALELLWTLLKSVTSHYEEPAADDDAAGGGPGGHPTERPGAEAPRPAHAKERRASSRGAPGVGEAGVARGALGRLLRAAAVPGPDQPAPLDPEGAPHQQGRTGKGRIRPVDAAVSAPAEPDLSDRDAAILAARKRGDTLQEIGSRFGLSRERVRQILGTAASAEESKVARAERELAGSKVRHEEVLALFRAGLAPKVIASRLGLSRGCVGWLIESRATPADRAARKLVQRVPAQRTGPPAYSDEDLIDAVKQVARDAGRVPLSKEYDAIAKASGLPSLSTVESRFGGWSAALSAAGLTPLRERRPYSRRWTEEACLAAVRSVATELGALPTLREYERLATGRPDLPSAATVRNRLGSWSRVALLVEGEASA